MTALRLWRAPPDGLLAAVLLSFLATAGLFYVNILAALVDGLKSGLHFTTREAGFVAAANVYGAALGAFAAVFTVRLLNWRVVAVSALVGLIVLDLACTQITVSGVLIPARFIHGVIGGFLVGTSYGVFARTRAPDRVFGMLLVVQFGMGGLGVMILPRLAALYGAQVLFEALALFSLTALIMLPFLSDYPVQSQVETTTRKVSADWRPLLAALAAVVLFQCSNSSVSAYVIGLGRSFKLDLSTISATLGVSSWLAALGSLAVVLVGARFGRTAPILIGVALATVGMALYLVMKTPFAYALASTLTGIAWSFTIAYLLGLCAAFDQSGRSAALGGFCSKLGLASGPALGGVLLEESRYDRILLLACAGLLVSAGASLYPALKLDRTSKEA
jgi:predicted MFS family arabinose efflux permease